MSTLSSVTFSTLGVYVAMSNGLPITDGDGRALTIASHKDDLTKIAELMRAAKHYGYTENLDYEFIPEVRKVNDEEYLVQQQRLEAGLDPDPYEINSAVEAYREAVGAKHGKQNRRR